LRQVLAEEERRAEEREQKLWHRLYRKSWFFSRQDHALFLFGPKNNFRIKYGHTYGVSNHFLK
jgi:hypothetical protein